MDPSYNNSFGSFGANSGTPGGAPSGVPGGASSVGISGAGTSGVGTSGAGASNGASGNMSANATQGPIVSSGDTTVENFTSSEFPSGGLSIGGERKSRKGVIILLVVLVVLLIGGIAGYMAWKNGLFGGNGESSDSSSNEFVVDENVSMEVAFNRYANYIVSGEVKDDVVSDRALYANISLAVGYDESEFMENTKRLYEVFYNKLDSGDMREDFPFAEAGQIKSGLEYLSNKNRTIEIDEVELKQQYLEGGSSQAKRYINDMFADNAEDVSEDYLTRTKKDYTSRYYSALVDYWDSLIANGCPIDGSDVVTECSMESETIKSLRELLSGYDYNVFRKINEYSVLLNDYINKVEA